MAAAVQEQGHPAISVSVVRLGNRRSDGSPRILAQVGLIQVGAMSTWFSAAAVAPSLARDWHLLPAELGLLTVAVQLGFVVGALTASLSGVVDVLPTRWVLVGSALAAAGLNAGLIASGGDLRFSVVLRFGLGFSLAGVYPTGMKLLSGWFQAGRGMAIGTLVGALTLGSALPHFLAGIGLLGELPWQAVIAATSGGAVLSALVAAAPWPLC
jgi:hypothetical protein